MHMGPRRASARTKDESIKFQMTCAQAEEEPGSCGFLAAVPDPAGNLQWLSRVLPTSKEQPLMLLRSPTCKQSAEQMLFTVCDNTKKSATSKNAPPRKTRFVSVSLSATSDGGGVKILTTLLSCAFWQESRPSSFRCA